MREKVFNYLKIFIVILGFYLQSMISLKTIELYILLLLVVVLFSATKKYKSNLNTIVFSCIFALFFTIGNIVNTNIGLKEVLFLIIEFLGFYFLVERLLLYLNNDLKKVNIFEKNKKINFKKFILISTIVGFVLFLPYFLRFYPGIMTPDSFNQIWQAEGLLPYSNHHPWVHTLLLKVFYNIGYGITNNKNAGIAFYTVFQMLFVAFSFSYTTYILYKNNIKKWLVVLIWLFFFILPFNGIYSVTLWKDIIFSCCVLIFTVFIWDHYYNNYKWSLKNQVVFTDLSIMICLFRSNGLIAYLIFLIVLFILYRNSFKVLKYSILISLIFVFIVKLIIMPLFKVNSPDFVESISIPIQQVAYVIKENGNISSKELYEVSKIANIDQMMDERDVLLTYHVSDSNKNNIRKYDTNHYLDNNKSLYLKLWFNVGIKNPGKYVKAYVMQTSGYWYHNYGKYWIYRVKMKPGGNINHFKIDFYQDNLAPRVMSKGIDTILKINSYVYYKIWSIAMSFYVILFSLYITINRKGDVLPYVLSIAVLLTLLIATPVSSEFRYAYALFICAPFLFIVSLCENQKK